MKLFAQLLSFAAAIATGKSASIHLGDATPTKDELLQDGATAFVEDLVSQPSEYPNFDFPLSKDLK